jgi:hypothetical protein
MATISGNTVSALTVGTVAIVAAQAGNENFEAAGSVSQDLAIAQISVVAENKSVCRGYSIGLTASPMGGTWSGTGVIGSVFYSSGLAVGDYTLTYTYTSPQGCVGSTTATVTVNQEPIITAFSPTGNFTMCPGNTQVFEVSATGSGLSYEWSYPSGWILLANYGTWIRLQVPLNPTSYGSVTVTVRGANGCSNGNGITVMPGNCGPGMRSAYSSKVNKLRSGKNKNMPVTLHLESEDLANIGAANGNQVAAPSSESEQSAPSVYPNPANNELTLEVQSTEEADLPVTLYNENGTVVTTTLLPKGLKQLTLDTSGLANGNYILEVKDKRGKSRTQRVLILHKN